jgi:hypothetical protein
MHSWQTNDQPPALRCVSRPDLLTRGWLGTLVGEYRFGRAFRGEHLDSKRELALFTRRNCADTHDLASDFLAAIVRDRYHDRVLPSLAHIRMSNGSFDTKGGEGGGGDAPTGTRREAQMLPARRTDARALENHCPAVRAGTRCSGRSSANSGHDAWRAPSESGFVDGS